MKKIIPIVVVVALISIYFWQNFQQSYQETLELGLSSAQAETPTEIKKREEDVRKQMVQISKELGVTCVTCHQVKNWKDDSKEEFKIAKTHMKWVELLRSSGMNGENRAPEANCYMCHRGQTKYEWKVK